MLRNRRFSAILSLFMLLLVAAGTGMDGTVLCIMQDGQISIENTTSLCCSQADDADSKDGSLISSNKENQTSFNNGDSCLDIPLLYAGLYSPSANNIFSKFHAADFIVPSNHAAKSLWAAEKTFSSLSPPTAKPILASIRTVNLLI
jgi:hypothetical protein